MAYIDNLTTEQRAAFTAPSAGLLHFRAFVAEYRKAKPNASANEIQHAYQVSGGNGLVRSC